MAFRCDDCNYIFDRQRTNCPYCGGRIYSDNNSDQILLDLGYTYAPVLRRNAPPAQRQPEYDDPFADVNRLFDEQYGGGNQPAQNDRPVSAQSSPNYGTDHNTGYGTTVTNNSNNTSNTFQAQNDPFAARTPAQQDQTSAGIDFFASLGNTGTQDDVPTLGPDNVPDYFTAPRDDPAQRELDQLERQRRALERRYRRGRLMDRFTGLNGRRLFRIVVIILIIIVVVGLWSMREVIFRSLWNLLLSILSFVFVIWIIWMIIRSMFR